MESCEKNMEESIMIVWTIENFQFCCHKTGERLESPLINTNFSIQSSWRLWFYPRGEDDAEYFSFYLVREEGGPEVVDVDFQLFFYEDKATLNSTENLLNWYSFKIHQREGLKCFAPRWEVFHWMADPNFNRIVHLGCRIFNRKPNRVVNFLKHLQTRIERECISGTEIFDDITDTDSPANKDINVISPLENRPLININVSYIEDSIVINILPVNCKKIKYAVCNITIIKSWGREPPIEHVRSWLGEIKADIWRYKCLPSLKPLAIKAFYVHYVFAFSTEKIMELKYSGSQSFHQYLRLKPTQSAPTALENLKNNYSSQSFVDISVKSQNKIFPANKALFSVRSSYFKFLISFYPISNHILFNEDFAPFNVLIQFLYTDTLENLSLSTTLSLYKLSHVIGCHLLKMRCRNIILERFYYLNITPKLFQFSAPRQDSFFVTAIQNYIMTHYDLVIRSTDWEYFANEPELRKEVLLLKYKKQKTEISELCRKLTTS